MVMFEPDKNSAKRLKRLTQAYEMVVRECPLLSDEPGAADGFQGAWVGLIQAFKVCLKNELDRETAE
jgi:hypothetical protein